MIGVAVGAVLAAGAILLLSSGGEDSEQPPSAQAEAPAPDGLSDAEAKVAALDARAAIDQYRESNRGSYEGAAMKHLVALQPLLSIEHVRLEEVTANGYKLTATAEMTGREYSIEKRSDGATFLSCSPPGGGCPVGGEWSPRVSSVDVAAGDAGITTQVGGLPECPISQGPTTGISDAEGDPNPNVNVVDGEPVEVGDRPDADLRQVAVLSSQEYLCATFWLGEAPENALLKLAIHAPGRENALGSAFTVEASLSSSSTQVRLAYPGAPEGDVPGLELLGDDEVRTILVPIDAIPPPLRVDPLRFDWQASVLGAMEGNIQLSDCAPQEGHIQHPAGRVVSYEITSRLC